MLVLLEGYIQNGQNGWKITFFFLRGLDFHIFGIPRNDSGRPTFKLRAAKRGGFKRGFSRSGLVLPLLSFLGLSRFFRDFPDLLGNGPGIFPVRLFSLSRPIKIFFALTEFWGESSVSSSQPIICVPKRTHRVFPRTH